MRLNVKGLKLHPNGTYYFRRAVPPDLRQIVGQREWKRSLQLQRGDEAEAHKVAARLWKETQREINQLRSRQRQQNDPHILARQAAEWAASLQLLDGQAGAEREQDEVNGQAIEFDSQRDLVWDRMIEEAGREFGWDERGHPKALTPLQEARLAVLAAGRPIQPKFTVSQARDRYVNDRFGGEIDKATKVATDRFIDMVGDLPLEHISRAQVVDWMSRLANEEGNAENTIRRRVGVMKAIFNHIRDNYDLEANNPFVKHKVPRTAKAPTKRLPFTRSEWQKLDTYLGSPELNEDLRRILILLKHTGARPLEIAGLTVQEVRLEDDIPHLRLQPNDERKLKTNGSQRYIPLVGDAVEAARAAVGNARGEYLFPPNLRKSDNLSNRLRKALGAAGIKSEGGRKVVYSFRHSIAEAFRVAGVSEDIRRGVMGHEERGAAGSYGAERRPLYMLRDGLEAAVNKLGEVEGA